MTISETLKNILSERGITPSELARMSGVPQPRLHEIVTGKTKNPQLKTLQKIASALRISVDVLSGRGDSTSDVKDPAPTYSGDMLIALKMLESKPWWLEKFLEIDKLPPEKENEAWKALQKALKPLKDEKKE